MTLIVSSQAGLAARTAPITEPRGVDGLNRRAPGLDHGVFVPFRLMFGDKFTDVPIVEASLDGTLDPENNWKIGQAVSRLRFVVDIVCVSRLVYMHLTVQREENILILSGGLTIHNLRDFSCFAEDTAKPGYLDFDKAVLAAVAETDVSRSTLLDADRNSPDFTRCDPTAYTP